MIDLGEAKSIDMMIAKFRQSIIGDQSRQIVPINLEATQGIGRTLTEEGLALRTALFDPLIGALNGCTRLLLAPDGDLSTLPFEALPLDKNGRCLIDDYSIHYLTTGRDILRIDKFSSDIPNEPLVAADPDFDLEINPTFNRIGVISIAKEFEKPISRQSRDLNRNMLHFRRLVGTIEEGEEIAKLLNVQPVMAEKALESYIKSYRSPSILHIATHGFFLPNQVYDPNKDKISDLMEIGMAKQSDSMFNRLFGQDLENPMLRSGLALAGVNTWLHRRSLPQAAEDGLLTAEDVTSMDLTNTELRYFSL